MAFNELLADRTREIIARTETNVEEKKMFGGLCFMVNDKMCLGVMNDRLMVRFDPERYEEIIESGDCRPMDFTGKTMKGYVYVDIDNLSSSKNLEYWIDLALAYNKIAKVTVKKKK